MNNEDRLAHLGEIIQLLRNSELLLSIFKEGFEANDKEGFESAIQVLEGLRDRSDYHEGEKVVFDEMTQGWDAE